KGSNSNALFMSLPPCFWKSDPCHAQGPEGFKTSGSTWGSAAGGRGLWSARAALRPIIHRWDRPVLSGLAQLQRGPFELARGLEAAPEERRYGGQQDEAGPQAGGEVDAQNDRQVTGGRGARADQHPEAEEDDVALQQDGASGRGADEAERLLPAEPPVE